MAKKKVEKVKIIEKDQKALFIKRLAVFLAGDQGKKSIMLGMPDGLAFSLVKEWADLRNATPLFGYQTIQESEKILTEWLCG